MPDLAEPDLKTLEALVEALKVAESAVVAEWQSRRFPTQYAARRDLYRRVSVALLAKSTAAGASQAELERLIRSQLDQVRFTPRGSS